MYGILKSEIVLMGLVVMSICEGEEAEMSGESEENAGRMVEGRISEEVQVSLYIYAPGLRGQLRLRWLQEGYGKVCEYDTACTS